jgi:hypothetical protein
MKRKVFIFIILYVLFFYMVINCIAKDDLSQGELWNNLTQLDRDGVSISEMVKLTYIRGIADGIFLSVAVILDQDEKVTDKLTGETYFIRENMKEIIKVMDDLYEDPSNVNIKFDWMCYIACEKLRGENVELLIRDGRILGLLPY